MPFLVIGDPNIDEFKKIIRIIEPYADMLELGIPFSDPIADGKTIQEANQRAFKSGINTDIALKIIKEIRDQTEKPIIILTYYNILIQGSDTIKKSLDLTFKKLKSSGVDGIVIADLPVEESELVLEVCEKYNIFLIFLIAPSTPDERLRKILIKARGFIYLISVMGVTGARKKVSQETKDTIVRVRNKIENSIPIFVGFGISKPEHVYTLLNLGADGIIIGSAIINIIKANITDFSKLETEILDFIIQIKNEMIKYKSGDYIGV